MGKLRKMSKTYYLRQIMACLLVYCILLAVPMQIALANPDPPPGVGPSTGVGDWIATPGGAANTVGNTTIITANNGTVFDWKNFDIGFGHTVEHIMLPTDAVLHRINVTAGYGDGSATGINGNLSSPGYLFVVNPRGIVMGADAFIAANRFVASGLDLKNFSEFVTDPANGLQFESFSVDSLGEVVNNSDNINVAEAVFLIGKTVINNGTITSGSVVLAAGEKVYLAVTEGSGNLVVDVTDLLTTVPSENVLVNNGTINAPDGNVLLAAGDIYSNAISGVEDLAAIANKDIYLDGDFEAGEITLTADADDSGGVEGGSVRANTGSLTSTTGDIEISASDNTIVLNVDVDAAVDLLLNNSTVAGAGITLKAGQDVILADDKTMDGEGVLTVEADRDIILGGAVTAGGTMTLKADADTVDLEPGSTPGGMMRAKSILETTAGDIDIYGYAIDLRDDVTAAGDLILNNNTTAAADIILKAGINVQSPAHLTAEGNLTIEATGGAITAHEITMPEAPAPETTLTLTQNNKLDLEENIENWSGRNNTHLDATSTADSVTSIAATKWLDITAWAYEDIVLSDVSGDITTLELYAETRDIKITAENGKLYAYGPIDAGRDVVITATDESSDAIFLHANVNADQDILLNNNTWAYDGALIDAGRDVTVGDGTADGTTLTGEGALTVEADRHITLGGAVAASASTSGNLILMADAGSLDGDMIAYGTLTNPGGNIDIYSSDGTTELWDDVIVSGDLTLHNSTVMKAAGKLLQSTDEDVILAADKTLDSDFDLTIQADEDILLGDDLLDADRTVGSAGNVSANGDLTLTAGRDIYAHGALTSSGADVVISATGNTNWENHIELYGPVNAQNNIYITADDSDSDWGSLYAHDAITATTGEVDIFVNAEMTLDGPVSAHTDLTLIADNTTFNDSMILANDTLTAVTGDLEAEAEMDITFNDVASAGNNMTLDADSDGDDTGELNVNGLVAGGDINLSAGDNTINIYESADLGAAADVQADGDIILHNNTEADAGVVLNAGDDVVLVAGKTLDGLGDLTVLATDDVMFGVAAATHEADPTSGTPGDVSADGTLIVSAGDSVYAHGTITTTSGGDIEIYSSDTTTFLYGDYINAGGSVLLNNTTESYGDIIAGEDVTLNGTLELKGTGTDADQEITAANGKLLANDWVRKTSEGNLNMFGGYNSPIVAPDWDQFSVSTKEVTVDDGATDGELSITGNAFVWLDGDIYSRGDMTLASNVDADISGSDAGYMHHASGTIESLNGDIDISASGSWIHLYGGNPADYVTAKGDILLRDSTYVTGDRKLDAGDDVVLAGDKFLSYYAPLPAGALTVVAGDDIILGSADVDNHWDDPTDGSPGDVTANGDLILTAGDDIYAHGLLKTVEDSDGAITATAEDDIHLYNIPTSADADGTLTLIADNDGDHTGDLTVEGALYGNMYLTGYDLTVNGNITSYGPLDIDSDYRVTLNGTVEAQDDITITVEGDEEAYVYAADTIKSLAGSVDISAVSSDVFSSYAEIDLDGDVEAYVDLSLFADTTNYNANIYTEGLKTLTGDIDVFSDYDMEFDGPVEAYGNMLLTAGNDGDDDWAYGSVYAYDTLKSVTGDITINSSFIVDLYDAVEAYGNVTIINRQPYYVDCYVESIGSDATITALTGDVSITTDYYMELEGDIAAQGNITLIADGPVGQDLTYDSDGYIYTDAGLTTTTGDISASAEYDVTVYGNVQSGGTLDVDAGDDIELRADVSSVGEMTMDAGNDISLNEDSGDTTSNSNMTLIAGKTNNWGDVEAWGTLITTDADNGDLTVSAADNIRLYNTPTSADAAGELQLHADADYDSDGGDVVVDGDLYGNMKMDGVNVTVEGNVTSYGTLDVDADEDIQLKSNVSSVGEMTMDAGSDIELNGDSGNTSSDSTITLNAGDNITIGRPFSGEGNVTANGNMDIIAGTDADDTVKVLGKLTTTNGGNINVQAGGDIKLYGTFNDSMFESAQADGDLILDAEGDVDVLGDLISNTGNIEIYSSDEDDTTYLGGDRVQAFGNILLNNDTVFDGDDDQKVDAQTGTITANGWLWKNSDWGSLYLEAAGDISLADDVEAVWGGVSIISENGKIFTPDEFGGETDTLNVGVYGWSDDYLGGGVDLLYGPGKAAIIIASAENLNLGPDAELVAEGVYDDTGTVDDRAGVGFVDAPGTYIPLPPGDLLRDEGDPFDAAIYLASTDGDVDVSSPVMIGMFNYEEFTPQGAMVIDALDTVTFGALFEDSLANGDVGDRLEVVSRITEWLYQAVGRLPYPYGGGPFLPDYTYVLRGAGLDNPDITDGRAWVLEDPLDAAPLSREAGQAAEDQTLGLDGCPVLVAAASAELGIPGDTIEVSLANSYALNTDIQPCETCARLVNAAAILADADGSAMAAMNQVFNELAPAGAPYTPEVAASIVTAFAGRVNDGTQYATAIEYIDAFVNYIAVLNSEMGSPVGDSVAFTMQKYGSGVTGSDNANMAAFVAARLEAGETFGQ